MPDVKNRRKVLIDDRTTLDSGPTVYVVDKTTAALTEVDGQAGIMPPVATAGKGNGGDAFPVCSGVPTEKTDLFVECRRGGGVSIPRRDGGPQFRWRYEDESSDYLRGNGWELNYRMHYGVECPLPSYATTTGKEGSYNNSSTIILPSGRIVIAGEKRSNSGTLANYSVDIAWRDSGSMHWNVVSDVVSGSTGYRSPKLVYRPDGKLFLFYIVLEGTSEYTMGAYFSLDDGETWAEFSTKIAEGDDLTYYANSIDVAYANGNFYAVVGSLNGDFMTCLYSIDGGSTFRQIIQYDNSYYSLPGPWQMPKLVTLADETLLLVIYDDNGYDGTYGVKCTRLASGLDLPVTKEIFGGWFPHSDYGWQKVGSGAGDAYTTTQLLAWRGFDGLPYVAFTSSEDAATVSPKFNWKVYAGNMDGIEWSGSNTIQGVGLFNTSMTDRNDDAMADWTASIACGVSCLALTWNNDTFMVGGGSVVTTEGPTTANSLNVVWGQGNSNIASGYDCEAFFPLSMGISNATSSANRACWGFDATALATGCPDLSSGGAADPLHVVLDGASAASAGDLRAYFRGTDGSATATGCGDGTNPECCAVGTMHASLADVYGTVGNPVYWRVAGTTGSGGSLRGARLKILGDGTSNKGSDVNWEWQIDILEDDGAGGTEYVEYSSGNISLPIYTTTDGASCQWYEYMIAIRAEAGGSPTTTSKVDVTALFRKSFGIDGDRKWQIIDRINGAETNLSSGHGVSRGSALYYTDLDSTDSTSKIRLVWGTFTCGQGSSNWTDGSNASLFAPKVLRGLPMTALPNALTAGLYLGWGGTVASYDDEWEMNTSYQYPKEAIIPNQRGVWRTVEDGNDVWVVFDLMPNNNGIGTGGRDGIAVWGTNFMTCEMYLGSSGTTAPTVSPFNSLSSQISAGASTPTFVVTGIGGISTVGYTSNVIIVSKPSTSGWARDQWAGYYFRFGEAAITAGCPSEAYKILGNTEEFITLEGAAWSDAEVVMEFGTSSTGTIFCDRMFEIGTTTTAADGGYRYLWMKIPSQPGVGGYYEAKGIMIGYTHDFKQNWEWATDRRRIANVETVESPGGQRYVYTRGPARDEIDIEWTGAQDQNEQELRGLWERGQGGKVVVGLILDTEGDGRSFIPARMTGDFSRKTQALYVESDAGPILEVVDVDMITLSEEIK